MEHLMDSAGALRWFLRGTWVGACALAVALGSTSCGEALPVPRSGPHLTGEPVPVPYPPPPAKIEIIDEPPPELQGRGVWVDGSWQWNTRRWEWQSGGWQEPIAGAYYARPTTVRRGDGALVWFAGTWNYDPGTSPPGVGAPATDKPATDKPAADKPAADKPAAAESP